MRIIAAVYITVRPQTPVYHFNHKNIQITEFVQINEAHFFYTGSFQLL